MILSPAPLNLGTVKLLAGCTGITGGDDGVKLVHDYRPEVAPQTGSLVCTSVCQVEKVLVTIGTHVRKEWKGADEKDDFSGSDYTDPIKVEPKFSDGVTPIRAIPRYNAGCDMLLANGRQQVNTFYDHAGTIH